VLEQEERVSRVEGPESERWFAWVESPEGGSDDGLFCVVACSIYAKQQVEPASDFVRDARAAERRYLNSRWAQPTEDDRHIASA